MPENFTPPPAAKSRKKRQFPFGLLAMAIGAGLGCWGGIAMTKKAMTGPVWVQKIFGLPELPQIKSDPAIPTKPAVTPPSENPAPPIATEKKPNGRNIDIDIPEPDRDQNPYVKKDSGATQKPELKDIYGTWEISDKLQVGDKSGTVVSSYLFKEDETGEFAADGKKIYAFRWLKDGDDIRLQIDGDAPEGSSSWEVKMTWSLNADHTLLTLIPHGGKDPRATLYGSGPGVFRKKG